MVRRGLPAPATRRSEAWSQGVGGALSATLAVVSARLASASVGEAVVELSGPAKTSTFVDTTSITISAPSPSGASSPDLPPTGCGVVALLCGVLALIALDEAMFASRRAMDSRDRVDPGESGEAGEVAVGAHHGQAVLDADRGEHGIRGEAGP